MKRYFLLFLIILVSLVAVCSHVGIACAADGKIPNELKGIDFSKPKSKKEQERIINYYYKFSQEVGKKIDKEQNTEVKGSVKKDQKNKYAVGTFGDILYAYEFSVSVLCGSIVGHAAIVSTDRGWTIESYPGRGARMAHIKNTVKRKDGVSRYPNRWKQSSKVVGLRVKTAKRRHYMEAARYAMKQAALRKPYNINLCNKHTEKKFYCSQLVWQAWKHQGYRIECLDLGRYDPILPVELYYSPWTYVFYKK